jgi:rhodanese-related sulfurtransferase
MASGGWIFCTRCGTLPVRILTSHCRFGPTMSDSPDLPFEIDVHSVKKLLGAGDSQMLLLDCREPSEHATARIAGATLIPMKTIPQRLAELEPFRPGRIVVHCHHGGRSARVTTWLRQQGFNNVQNMTGGIDAWSLEIDPAVPRYK